MANTVALKQITALQHHRLDGSVGPSSSEVFQVCVAPVMGCVVWPMFQARCWARCAPLRHARLARTHPTPATLADAPGLQRLRQHRLKYSMYDQACARAQTAPWGTALTVCSTMNGRGDAPLPVCPDHAGPGASTCQVLQTETQEAVAGSRPAALLPACPTSSETGVVSVAISVNRRVDWGESLAVVGQDTSLGSWQPGQSLPLAWSEGDVWSAVVGLPPGVHEFKVGLCWGHGAVVFSPITTVQPSWCMAWHASSSASLARHLQLPQQQQMPGAVRC